jgi:hypothetical protein
MKLAATIVLTIAGALCLPALLSAADLESGFMDTAWGSAPSQLQGFTPLSASGKISYFINPKRVYRIFDTDLPDVVYGFYDNQFFAVYVNLEGIDAYSQIKHYVNQKYGLPKISYETRGDLTTYAWKIKDTRIKLKLYETSGSMKMSFYYLPLATLANRDMQKTLEDEPPAPVFPLSPQRQKEAIEHMELLNF